MRVIAIIAILAIAGCSKAPERLSTHRAIGGREVLAQVPYATLGDDVYAEVRADALPGMYESFRSDLFKKGVVKWDERFDCNHFAAYYVALAQIRFFEASFHSSTPAKTLALAPYWVRSSPNTAHALVVALTDRGIVYIEPQTGKEVALTAYQKANPMLALF